MAAVKEGDCIVSLAAAAGIRDYHLVLDHGPNATLKDDRPNPNMLVIGDTVELPDTKTKVEKRAVDKTWKFEVKRRPPPKLLIILLDRENKPLKSVKWTLVGSQTVEGKTKKDGKVELKEIPPTETAATLTVLLGKADDDDEDSESDDDKAEYPPQIVASHFKDVSAEPPDRSKVEWQLSIGGLPSPTHKSGVQARLHNLGFGCKVGADDSTTKRAVKAYQQVHLSEANGSGRFLDIRDDIKDHHEKP